MLPGGRPAAGRTLLSSRTVCVKSVRGHWPLFIKVSKFTGAASGANSSVHIRSTAYTPTLGGTPGCATNPSVTVTVPASGNVLVTVTGRAQTQATGGAQAFIGYAVTGATTTAALDARSFSLQTPSNAATAAQGSATYRLTGLATGSTTFTLQYRTTSGTATFANRNITAIPLP